MSVVVVIVNNFESVPRKLLLFFALIIAYSTDLVQAKSWFVAQLWDTP